MGIVNRLFRHRIVAGDTCQTWTTIAGVRKHPGGEAFSTAGNVLQPWQRIPIRLSSGIHPFRSRRMTCSVWTGTCTCHPAGKRK